MSKTLNLEDCVTFEIVQKLKEKGHPLLRVIKQNGNPIVYDLPQNHPNWQNCKSYYIPTISQVLKWLRDEKKLYVEPTLVSTKNGLKWDFTIVDLNTADIIFESRAKYSSYEEATLAGIDYVLDYVVK